jgi:hypothetical protein
MQPSKSSLDFILSPSTFISQPPANRSPTPPLNLSRLESLPRTLLSQIAFHLTTSSPSYRPASLIPLLLTSHTLNNNLTFNENPQLYNTLFRATFDSAALTRRYEWMKQHLSDVAGRGKKMFDLFKDPKSWAEDYKARWELAGRMKRGIMEEGEEEEERVIQDLWCCWFLLTENGEHIRRDQLRGHRWKEPTLLDGCMRF